MNAALQRATDAWREKAKQKARTKLFSRIVTTYGYGALGAALGKPFIEGAPITI